MDSEKNLKCKQMNKGEITMYQFFKKVVFFAVFFLNISAAMAILEHDEDDLSNSKNSFLLSGADYQTLMKENKGTMTLCLNKDSSGEYKDPALVFEIFNSQEPKEVSLRIVHFQKSDDSCGGGYKKLMIEGSVETLKKAYRAVKRSAVYKDQKADVPTLYTRFASWNFPTHYLINALYFVNQDVEHKKIAKSSKEIVDYISSIMRKSGLENVEFGWWYHTTANLKTLAEEYVRPRPDHTFPELLYKE